MATNKLIDLSRLSRFWDKVKAYIDTNDNAIVDKIYPVGSIYMSVTDSTAAQVEARFGGTWVAFGTGKTLVGVDSNDSDFNTVEETGGTKSNSYTPSGSNADVTLTAAQSGLPKHKHPIGSHTHTYSKTKNVTNGSSGSTGDWTLTVNQIPSHYHVQALGTNQGVVGSGSYRTNTQVSGEYTTAVAIATAYQQTTLSTGGGKAHNHSLNSHTHGLMFGDTQTTGISISDTSDVSASDATASHNHTFTGTAANISTVQPYITVYMYKRTA